jgi:hypothetical protein
MEKKTTQFGVRLTEEVREALRRAARDDARSSSSLAEKIIADWLRAHGWMKIKK